MDDGGRAAMLYDLQHADLSNFDGRRIPLTAALQDQKFHSMEPVEAASEDSFPASDAPSWTGTTGPII